jgi:hypothetical protein
MFIKTKEKIFIKMYNFKKIIKIPISLNNKIYFDKNTNCVLFNKNQLKKN